MSHAKLTRSIYFIEICWHIFAFSCRNLFSSVLTKEVNCVRFTLLLLFVVWLGNSKTLCIFFLQTDPNMNQNRGYENNTTILQPISNFQCHYHKNSIWSISKPLLVNVTLAEKLNRLRVGNNNLIILIFTIFVKMR